MTNFDRRGFLAACSRAGVASALLPGTLYTLASQAQESGKPMKITPELLDDAAALADAESERLELFRRVRDELRAYLIEFANAEAPPSSAT